MLILDTFSDMRTLLKSVEINRTRSFTVQLVPGEYFMIMNFWDYRVNLPVSGIRPNYIRYKKSLIRKFSVSGESNCRNRMGDQTFDSFITAIEYVGGYTFIGFHDGRILKLQGTGGTGFHMFNVVESSGGFEIFDTNFQSYLVGSHRFQNSILDIVYIDGKTLVCFKGGKILKVNGSGGGGYNVFAITETFNSFSGIPGYNYYSGDEKLDTDVTNITLFSGLTLISFADGRQIKIGGSGGTGHNMFKIVKTNYGYAAQPGTNHLHGSNKFNSPIISSLVVGNYTFFSFEDGRIIKILGSGGTGQNMFNIIQTSGGYAIYSTNYTNYLIGSHKFYNDHRALSMVYANGFTFMMLYKGFILKIQGTGGGGQNMFNIAYGLTSLSQNNIYYNAGGVYPSYLMGAQRWSPDDVEANHLAKVDEFMFYTYTSKAGAGLFSKFTGVVPSTEFVDMFGTDLSFTGLNSGRMISDGSSTSALICSGWIWGNS
jgi:hypothetical protein